MAIFIESSLKKDNSIADFLVRYLLKCVCHAILTINPLITGYIWRIVLYLLVQQFTKQKC